MIDVDGIHFSRVWDTDPLYIDMVSFGNTITPLFVYDEDGDVLRLRCAGEPVGSGLHFIEYDPDSNTYDYDYAVQQMKQWIASNYTDGANLSGIIDNWEHSTDD